MTGNPIGAPRWPFPGGLLKQPHKLFQACKLLRMEWPHLDRERVEARDGVRRR